jgi:photosystem II stability/assembly factor-like uncharacterized protein
MAAPVEKYFSTAFGRVFAQWGGAAPNHSVAYLGQSRVGALSESLGDVTPVFGPSSVRYGEKVVVGKTRGDPGLPSTSLIARFGLANKVLTQKCEFDLHVHWGQCKDPTDFEGGWDKGADYENAVFTNRGSDELTLLDQADAPINLTGDLTADKFWEYDPMILGEEAQAQVTTNVVDVMVADYVSCGECGYESDGNKRIFVLQDSSGLASPGLLGHIIWTADGGKNWDDESIDTWSVSESPSAFALVGDKVVAVSDDVASLSYATLADMGTWYEVTTGFVAGMFPKCIFSMSATLTWIGGLDGYIYFTDDPTAGVVVQVAGGSGDDMNSIHGIDSRNLLCGGEDGTLYVTTNGGRVWTLAPSVPSGLGANDITVVWMRTLNCWIIGDSAGKVWYTVDGGNNWTETTIPVASPTHVTDLCFVDHPDSPFGFMTVHNASSGFILRTINGGKSWYQLPDGPGAIPTNKEMLAVAAGLDASFVVAGGMRTNATGDGIVVFGVGNNS